MPNRGKVITELRAMMLYHRGIGNNITAGIAEDALTLLEAADDGMSPVNDGTGCFICGNQGYACGVVGRRTENGIEKYCNYCPECGMKVKLE